MNVYSHSTSNDYSLNAVEYMVKKKTDSSAIIKRIVMIIVAIAVVASLFYFFWHLFALGAVALLLIAYVVKMLWGMTSIEFEYTIVQGELTMDKIIGARKRKTIASLLIRDAESIAPYTGELPKDAAVIDASAHYSRPDTWVAIYKDEKGNKTALIFSAFNKGLDTMAYYNRTAVSSERIKDELNA